MTNELTNSPEWAYIGNKALAFFIIDIRIYPKSCTKTSYMGCLATLVVLYNTY